MDRCHGADETPRPWGSLVRPGTDVSAGLLTFSDMCRWRFSSSRRGYEVGQPERALRYPSRRWSDNEANSNIEERFFTG